MYIFTIMIHSKLPLILFSILLSFKGIGSDHFPQLTNLLVQGEYNEAIEQINERLSRTDGKARSQLLFQLALIETKDQEMEKAFAHFLEALSLAPLEAVSPVQSQEKKLYDQALQIYLNNHTGQDLKAGSEEIIKKYSPFFDEHPNYYLLNFMLAAAYANLGKMDQFFERFYESYVHLPDSFMAYRIQAILHQKLFERAATPQAKQIERQQVFIFAQKASNANNADTELYKLMISMSDQEEKRTIVEQTLNKIMCQNIIIPRSDIIFYVLQALDTNQKDLAQEFVNKSREWYQYSRVINEAQQAVDRS